MINQCFPFKSPFMEYIFKNVQPQHLIKLYRCSKFFYNKFRRNFIQHLEIIHHDEQEVFDFTKTAIHFCNPALSKLVDFWIIDSLILHVHRSVPFLPEFSNLTIKELQINDDIIWEEFETLTRPATIEKLKLQGIFPLHNSGIYAETRIEDIIAKVPNATSIE
uniref:F-box domain-containing protein n=1 Tax=Panagrolaimus davidi TaxID=227884 RepID=A0A914PQK7_9BILA